jgi:hypothetical protein
MIWSCKMWSERRVGVRWIAWLDGSWRRIAIFGDNASTRIESYRVLLHCDRWNVPKDSNALALIGVKAGVAIPRDIFWGPVIRSGLPNIERT